MTLNYIEQKENMYNDLWLGYMSQIALRGLKQSIEDEYTPKRQSRYSDRQE